VTVATFEPELGAARKAFERYVVCLEKTPEDCLAALHSLLEKAIKAYEGRAPGLRHGLALDRHLTIILSQNETDRPHCAIYFNLFTPYSRKGALAAPPSPEGTAPLP